MNPRTKQPESALPALASHVDIALLERLFDRSPDVAFFVKDILGRYVAVNESLLARHGLKSKSQVIGKCPRDICPGDFGRIPTEQDEKVLRTGRPLVDHLEMQWHLPNDPVCCLTTKLPMLDSNGAVVGLIGFSRDVRVPVEPHEIPEDFASTLEEFEQTLSSEVARKSLPSFAATTGSPHQTALRSDAEPVHHQVANRSRVAHAARCRTIRGRDRTRLRLLRPQRFHSCLPVRHRHDAIGVPFATLSGGYQLHILQQLLSYTG